jgi:hypothetical protein
MKRLAHGAALVVWLTVCGCSHRDIDTFYGRRRGATGGASVNGVGVLAGMFEEAGHKVTTKRHLCPQFRGADVVVWAPDDYSPPDEKTQQFFEDWLRGGYGRTLIYIGRDYDAAASYWEKVQPTAPPEQVVEVMRRAAQARARRTRARTGLAKEEHCGWFRVVRDRPPREVGRQESRPTPLRGKWCDRGGLDSAQVELVIEARFEVPEPKATDGGNEPLPAEVLLAAGDDVFVRRLTHEGWDEGQILVVTNGSFLLNLPLVEKEHRKLAARLIAECGPPGNKVIFVESGTGGLLFLEKEPGEGQPTYWRVFTVRPIGAILLHFAVVGLVFLCGRMPIFGRPQALAADAAFDFGKHVQALGELLAGTQDQPYARQRLEDYEERVKRETVVMSGSASNRDSPASSVKVTTRSTAARSPLGARNSNAGSDGSPASRFG